MVHSGSRFWNLSNFWENPGGLAIGLLGLAGLWAPAPQVHMKSIVHNDPQRMIGERDVK